MIIQVDNYSLGYKIVSLSLDKHTRDDLNKENVEQLYIEEGKCVLLPEDILLDVKQECIEELEKLENYDVLELWEDGRISIVYDASQEDNIFFVTGSCNSNCLMCPSPEEMRKGKPINNISDLIRIAEHIPSDANHLTITGGEPFLSGEAIFDLIQYIKGKFCDTELLILTNGRVFCIDKYAELMRQSAPERHLIGIPIHGSNKEVHDYITQVKGSFEQTIVGIDKLLLNNINIELRIVVSRLNGNDLFDLSNLIVSRYKRVRHVSIMAMEMTGSAYRNREEVWIPYSESFKEVGKAIDNLIDNGITVKLFNYPLCTVDKRYWMLCEKSISGNKVRFDEKCDECVMKDACGGVFAGTYLLEKNDINVIQ